MPRLHVDHDVSLYYEVRGEQGPPLVLLNGLSQSTANWISQSRQLAKSFRVIMLDARGQGKTPLGERGIDPSVLIEDIDRLLDHLELDRVAVCGFSFGARLALFYAAHRPERVERVILTSTGLSPDPLRILILRSWRKVIEYGGLEGLAWCAMPWILGVEFISQYERMVPSMIKASIQRNTVEGLTALMDTMTEFPEPSDDAALVQAPALVIVSAEDPLVGVDSAQKLAESLNARFLVVEQCGHTVPIEQPEVWRGAVVSFLLENEA